ncbi:MAG: GDP-mannose 4,6-dehydratase [Deltaproteobacteria bacterium]|nr:GDP-mannose 4,6-dehydratase [Deltaproteobacteria bacterium]
MDIAKDLFWHNKRVFVTGATGMIGSWLVNSLLKKGAYVVALVRDADPMSLLFLSGDISRVSVVNGALEDFYTLERAINENEIDTVFHLGAQTIVGTAYRFPLSTFETNVRGTYNLMEACRIHEKLVKRIVIASSDKAYGDHEELPYTEDMELKGRHPYDVSKTISDFMAQTYHHTYGTPVAITRCGNVYGGGDLNWSRIVPGTIRALLSGQCPIVRSDGTFVRDYIYVIDVISAYMQIAEHLDDEITHGHSYNVSNEDPKNVLEMVAIIGKLMGFENLKPDIQNTAIAEIHDQCLSAEKARNTLNWKPTYDLVRGLKETIEWYRSFLKN